MKKILKDWKKIIDDDNLKNEIDKAIEGKNDKTKVLNKVYKKYVEDDNSINSIKNLVLLSREINSSLQNGFFFQKRKEIIGFDKKGRFIPIGTKRVFLKYYSDNPEPFDKWNKEDQKAYLEHIKETLKNYIKVNENGK